MTEPHAVPVNEPGSLRGRLIRRLALLLALILLLSSLSAYWSARRAADTAYDRTLLASARAIADGLYTTAERLNANVPYVALDTFAYDSAGRIYYQVLDVQGGWFRATKTCRQPRPAPRAPRTTRRWRIFTMRNTAIRVCVWSACCSRSASPGSMVWRKFA